MAINSKKARIIFFGKNKGGTSVNLAVSRLQALYQAKIFLI